MRLSKKNLIYSLLLAGILMLLMAGYFVFMLPSLYVDYMQSKNLNSVIAQHRSYLEDGNYGSVSVNNPVACFTLEIPYDENCIYFTNKMIKGKLEPQDGTISEVLEEIKELSREDAFAGEEQEDLEEVLKARMEFWMEELSGSLSLTEELPVTFALLEKNGFEEMFSGETFEFHRISDELYVWESGVSDGNNQYTNYLAVSVTKTGLVLSYLPVMAPQMTEITPVVMQSIPMISVVLVLLVLIFSRVYSRGIVTPIVTLADRTGNMRAERILQYGEAGGTDFAGAGAADIVGGRKYGTGAGKISGERGYGADDGGIRGCAEIALLSDTLDSLYDKLRESYLLLAEKNRALSEENERQEVFLRASSHQLKTPIAAALLLVEGMVSRIGKYQDRDHYLPQVKKQLLSMKGIVDDILELNRPVEAHEWEKTDLSVLVQKQLSAYEPLIREKRLLIDTSQAGPRVVNTDEGMLTRIVDNLLSNAVAYTPEGGMVFVITEERALRIINTGAEIPETLLPHIFEPFVKGDQGGKSHGLGLYIASYYAKRLGMELVLKNWRTEEEEVNLCGFTEREGAASSKTEGEASAASGGRLKGVCACLKF